MSTVIVIEVHLSVAEFSQHQRDHLVSGRKFGFHLGRPYVYPRMAANMYRVGGKIYGIIHGAEWSAGASLGDH